MCGNRLPRIYDQLRQTINMSDASKDLKWWSQNHGVEMPILWPTFEVKFAPSTCHGCPLDIFCYSIVPIFKLFRSAEILSKAAHVHLLVSIVKRFILPVRTKTIY